MTDLAGGDAELIAASLEEPERFAALFDRHPPAIHRYAARRLGRDAADRHANLPGTAPAGDISDFDPDKLQVRYGPNQEAEWEKEGYDDRSQRQFYRFLATLPSNADRMMKRIREEHAIDSVEGETRAQRDWREIDVLYRSVLVPPNVQAGLFRALAKIPGARVTTGVNDPLGRAAIGVSRDDGQMVTARAAWGVVNKPGARP
ncbi:CU044_5270 family protein [Streptomyces sp. NPDC029041]|uniref:CU044_5270 family protein n=1 Tax=Streptomyces sp. NPDC029041 TaxID=3155727 RepID=UPI0033FB92D0